MSLSVTEAIRKRHSTRAFLQQSVEKAVIEQLLETARFAPSGVNTQPWQVAVVAGEAKQNLQAAFLAEFESGRRGNMDYGYYPDQWRPPYKQRRVATGKQLYGALKIERGDKEGQKAQWAANYRAFDAPVMLIFLMDDLLNTGSFLDYGMFLQNLMLLAEEAGLATCPQGALGEYPNIIRQQLGYDDSHIVLGGMALGYEDKAHPVNQYRTEREEVEHFSRFFD